MKSSLLLMSIFILGHSLANAVDNSSLASSRKEGTSKVETPKIEIPSKIETLKMSGSCPKTQYKQTKDCQDSAEEPYQTTFTFYKFDPKPSKEVKTTTKECSKNLIEVSLKLPENDISRLINNPEVIDKVKLFRVESCTLLENTPMTPQLAVIALEQVTTTESDENNFNGKIIFVKVDNKDVPQKIVKVIHSSSLFIPERESYEVKKICDTNGDGQAEVILSLRELMKSKYSIASFESNVDKIVIDTWLIDQTCDHTIGD